MMRKIRSMNGCDTPPVTAYSNFGCSSEMRAPGANEIFRLHEKSCTANSKKSDISSPSLFGDSLRHGGLDSLLNDETYVLQKKLVSILEENRELISDIQDLLSENDALTESNVKYTKENKHLRDQNEKAQRDIEALQEKLEYSRTSTFRNCKITRGPSPDRLSYDKALSQYSVNRSVAKNVRASSSGAAATGGGSLALWEALDLVEKEVKRKSKEWQLEKTELESQLCKYRDQAENLQEVVNNAIKMEKTKMCSRCQKQCNPFLVQQELLSKSFGSESEMVVRVTSEKERSSADEHSAKDVAPIRQVFAEGRGNNEKSMRQVPDASGQQRRRGIFGLLRPGFSLSRAVDIETKKDALHRTWHGGAVNKASRRQSQQIISPAIEKGLLQQKTSSNALPKRANARDDLGRSWHGGRLGKTRTKQPVESKEDTVMKVLKEEPVTTA